MVLTPQEIAELKSQLSAQIQHLPKGQKEKAQAQIDSLSPEALEELVKQQQNKEQKTIFRMIVDKDVKSAKIDSDEHSLAVLEIAPVSKGHTIIIPRNPVAVSQNIPSQIFSFAEKLAGKLLEALKAKTVDLQTETKFGEKIINLIPNYDDPVNLNSPRKKASEKELENIIKMLEPVPKRETIKIESKILPSGHSLKINRRIP